MLFHFSYFDYAESMFPHVSTEVIGQSLEGQDLRLIKLCRDGCGTKPAVYLQGGLCISSFDQWNF